MEQRKVIQNEMEKLLAKGVIEPSRSEWSSPIVLAKKKDGSLRICVDLRMANKMTKDDVYALPTVQDALSSFDGAQFFTTLDCQDGYWHIKLDNASKEKTAFITQDGLYQYRVMTFGAKNARAFFQRFMDLVYAGLKWNILIIYLDDTVIFSKINGIRYHFKTIKV